MASSRRFSAEPENIHVLSVVAEVALSMLSEKEGPNSLLESSAVCGRGWKWSCLLGKWPWCPGNPKSDRSVVGVFKSGLL